MVLGLGFFDPDPSCSKAQYRVVDNLFQVNYSRQPARIAKFTVNPLGNLLDYGVDLISILS